PRRGDRRGGDSGDRGRSPPARPRNSSPPRGGRRSGAGPHPRSGRSPPVRPGIGPPPRPRAGPVPAREPHLVRRPAHRRREGAERYRREHRGVPRSESGPIGPARLPSPGTARDAHQEGSPVNGPIDLSGAWHNLSGPALGPLGHLVPLMNLLGMLIIAFGLVAGFRWRLRGLGSPPGNLGIISVGLFLAGPGLFIPLLLSLTDIVINGLYSAVGAQPEETSSAPSEEPTTVAPTPDPSPASDGGGLGDLPQTVVIAIGVMLFIALVGLAVMAYHVYSEDGGGKTPREIKREEKSKQKIAMVEAQKELDERWSEAKIAHDRAFERWSKYETDLGE